MALDPLWYTSLYPQAGPMAQASRQQAGVFVTPNQQQNQQQGSLAPIPQSNPYLASLARNMMATGSSTEPVSSPLAGLARALTGAAGGYFAGQANEAQQAQKDAQEAQLAELFGLPKEAVGALPVDALGEVAKYRSDTAKTRAKATETGFKEERDLRKEYQALSKDFRTQRDAYQRVVNSAERPTPAGDLALIFNYMKVLDPASVVRESEFAQAAATGAFGERIKAAVGRVVSGERLSDMQRADFVSRAGKLYGGAMGSQRARESAYGELAQSYGRDPGRVVTDYIGDVVPLGPEESIEISSGEPLIEQPPLGDLLQDIGIEAGTGEGAAPIAAPQTAEDYGKIPKGEKYQHPDDPVGQLRTKQ